MRVVRENIRGMAALETALFLAVILGVICSALGVVDYVRQVIEVRRIAEQMIRSNRAPTLTLQRDSGGLRTAVSATQLQQIVSQMVGATSQQLQQRLPNNDGARFRIEAAFRLLDIDPNSGAPRGILSTPQGAAHQGEFISRGDRDCASLEPLFILRAGELRVNSNGVTRSRFGRAAADPTVIGMPTVLLGLKVAVSLEDTALARLFPVLTEATSCSVVAARFEGR